MSTPGFLTSVRRHPSAVLLAGQFVAVMLYPFLEDNTVGRAALGVVSMLLVGFAIAAVRNTPALLWVALLLGLPAMVFTVIEAFSPDTGWVVLVSACLHAPFYFYVSYATLRYIYDDDRVTTDELYATASAFTVVAWGFAYVYAAVQVIWPGSFVVGTDDHQTWFELLFVSFTNLCSVGFSDIVPANEHVRSVIMVQQVTGVLYVAMVVARLVGLTVSKAQR